MTEAFSGNDLMDQKRYPSIMDKVVLAAENAKLRPLAGARTPLGDEHPDGADFGFCPTCGVRPALRDDGHGTFRCSACDAETRLGRAYPKARAVVLDSRNIQGRIDRIGDINIGLPDAPFPSIAGRGFRFRGEAEHPKLPLAEKFAGAYVPRHTAATLARADLSGARADAGEADDAEVGDILTFAELAVLSQADGKGRAMLATLKADVDRLGQIFTRGMGERRSLARTAALSRMMDAFFTGFLPHRLKQDFPWIYTVYAGGDDLLLLGPWRDILRFGQVLRDDFDAFTGHSAHVTLSCGIALFAPKMPVSLAAHEAEERLSQAKHSGRNRVHLITPVESTALTWVEYRVALDDAETLHAYLNDPHSGVTTALLYKLLWFDDRHKQADAGRPEAFDWIGKLGYLLHRTLGGTQHDTVRQYLLKLMGLGPQMKLFGGAAAPAARIALSIAIYRNR